MKRSCAAALGALCLGAIALTGCGSGQSSTTAAQTTATSSADSTALPASALKTFAKYTGSQLGAAGSSQSPVVLGYVNQQGGATGFPEYTTQVNALVDLLNSKLDGIDGHPIKLDPCYVVSSDQQAQTCAQQFADNSSIKAILQYPLINGDTTFHQVVDPTEIPIFGPIAASPSDGSAKTAFYATGPAFSTTQILVSYVSQELKPKSVAVVGVQGDAVSQITAVEMEKGLEKVGVSAKLGMISPTSSDSTAPLIAAGAQSADAIVAMVGNAQECNSIASTLDSLDLGDTPVTTLGTCVDPSLQEAQGEYPKWTYLTGWPSLDATPETPAEKAEVDATNAFFSATGGSDTAKPYIEGSVQGVLFAVRELNKAGGPTASRTSIADAARSDQGPLFLGPDQIKFGVIPTLPAIPTLAQRLYKYEGNGEWVDAVEGWYTGVSTDSGPPPGE